MAFFDELASRFQRGGVGDDDDDERPRSIKTVKLSPTQLQPLRFLGPLLYLMCQNGREGCTNFGNAAKEGLCNGCWVVLRGATLPAPPKKAAVVEKEVDEVIIELGGVPLSPVSHVILLGSGYLREDEIAANYVSHQLFKLTGRQYPVVPDMKWLLSVAMHSSPETVSSGNLARTQARIPIIFALNEKLAEALGIRMETVQEKLRDQVALVLEGPALVVSIQKPARSTDALLSTFLLFSSLGFKLSEDGKDFTIERSCSRHELCGTPTLKADQIPLGCIPWPFLSSKKIIFEQLTSLSQLRMCDLSFCQARCTSPPRKATTVDREMWHQVPTFWKTRGKKHRSLNTNLYKKPIPSYRKAGTENAP